MSLEKMGQAAREAAYQLATISTAQKNRALAAIADELEARSEQILAANDKDIAAGREAGLSEAMLDRLLLNPARLVGDWSQVAGFGAAGRDCGGCAQGDHAGRSGRRRNG